MDQSCRHMVLVSALSYRYRVGIDLCTSPNLRTSLLDVWTSSSLSSPQTFDVPPSKHSRSYLLLTPLQELSSLFIASLSSFLPSFPIPSSFHLFPFGHSLATATRASYLCERVPSTLLQVHGAGPIRVSVAFPSSRSVFKTTKAR